MNSASLREQSPMCHNDVSVLSLQSVDGVIVTEAAAGVYCQSIVCPFGVALTLLSLGITCKFLFRIP